MNNRNITIFLGIIAFATIPVYWLQMGFHIVAVRDTLFMSTIFMAMCGGIFAVWKFGINRARSITLLSFAIALTSVFIAESIFEYHYIKYYHNIPFPSVEDYFNLAYYIFFFIGLMNEIRIARINWKKVNKKMLLLLAIGCLILVGIVSYFGVYKSYDPTLDLFSNLVSMGYGVGDLLLILTAFSVFVLVREYRGGRLARIWLTFFIALLLVLTADITWSFYSSQYHNEVWFYKSLLDTIWMLAYLSYAKALFDFGFSIDDAYAKIKQLRSSVKTSEKK